MRVWYFSLFVIGCSMAVGTSDAPALAWEEPGSGYDAGPGPGGSGGMDTTDAALEFEQEARLFLEDVCGLCDAAAGCCRQEGS